MRNRYLVAYDVSNAKRLRKVFNKLEGYGDALQYSLFSCDLSARERVLLVADLTRLIHHKEDRVIIVDLGPAAGRATKVVTTMGRQDPPPVREAKVVG